MDLTFTTGKVGISFLLEGQSGIGTCLDKIRSDFKGDSKKSALRHSHFLCYIPQMGYFTNFSISISVLLEPFHVRFAGSDVKQNRQRGKKKKSVTTLTTFYLFPRRV